MKQYLDFVPDKGIPMSEDVYIECTNCGDISSTKPIGGFRCKCLNVKIDSDFGRLSVKDWSRIKLFEETE